MQEEKLIKSKERVKKFAEVFTPMWMVKRMCDYLDAENDGQAFSDPAKTFIDMTCGNGQFLVEIVRRKLLLCKTDADAVHACGTVYGIDIQPDNVQECRERIERQVHEVFPGAIVMPTLERNIVCGDALNPEGVWFMEEHLEAIREITKKRRKKA